MPSVLITTSRRTSNRVRSFTRDLMSVFPNSERFNRGGMSLEELIARTKQSGAKAVLIVSISKGNPHELSIISATGDTMLSALIDSVQLRREIHPSQAPRINDILEIEVGDSPSAQARQISEMMSSLMEVPLKASGSVAPLGEQGVNLAIMRFVDISQGRLIWTYHHAYDGIEIGPRIRVFSVRRITPNEY